MRTDEQIRLVKELLAHLDSGTNVDAGGLRRNPVEAYTDPDRAAREWHEFFQTRPQIIGLSGDLGGPNTFLTTDDLGFPLLATRDGDGTFHAFVNSCRHRGAVVETRERGEARRFACPFHAWTYDGSGTLVGLPKSEHFGQEPAECLDLVALPAVEWGGLLIVHPQVDGTIDPEAMFTEELAAELLEWDYGELEYLDRDSYDVACNWKLAMDTFGETYHFGALHKDSLFQVFHGNVQCYDTFGINHRMILTRREIDAMRHRPEDEWSITEAALPVYWLFPNAILMPFTEGAYLVRAYPIPGEPGHHVSRITFYVRPGMDPYTQEDEAQEAGMSEEFRARFEHVEAQRMVAEVFAAIIRDEDYEMSASQQRTAESGRITHTVFGRNEPALHHYHNTFRTELGLDPLPLLDSVS